MIMSPEQEKKFDDIHTSVTRLETAFLGKGGVQDQVIDHEARLRVVEEAKTTSAAKIGILTTLAAGSGALGAYVSSFFGKH